MKDSIKKYFKVGTIHWMSYPPAVYDYKASLCKILKDDFFDAIEITKIPEDQSLKVVKGLIDQAHMTLCYGAQPILLGGGLNPNDPDEEKRLKAQEALVGAIDEAHLLGATGIAFLSGNWSKDTKALCYQQLVKTTSYLCDYAAKKDMAVNLEVFDYDMDKAALIGPAPYAAQFAAEVSSAHPNFGLMVDLSHFPTTYETSRFVIQTLRPYIRHLHIGNAVVVPGKPAYGDKHPRFGYPNSANDTEALLDFFTILKQEGFFNAKEPYVLSMEVTPVGNEDADIVLANTKRVIQRAWALLED